MDGTWRIWADPSMMGGEGLRTHPWNPYAREGDRPASSESSGRGGIVRIGWEPNTENEPKSGRHVEKRGKGESLENGWTLTGLDFTRNTPEGRGMLQYRGFPSSPPMISYEKERRNGLYRGKFRGNRPARQDGSQILEESCGTRPQATSGIPSHIRRRTRDGCHAACTAIGIHRRAVEPCRL